MWKPSRKIRDFLYRSTFALFTLLLILFSAVLPIDTIAQAAESENNAFNTFIVVGALVVFVVVCVTLLVGRILYYRSCLIDIPRRYLPITPADLPHEESREFIVNSMERSKKLTVLFNTPQEPVIHAGLEPPRRCDIPNYDKIFPEYLDYKAAMKSIRSKFKYTGVFLPVSKTRADIDETISDLMNSNYIKNDYSDKEETIKAKRFIQLYEYCTFSGEDVTREQFLEFVELYIYFADTITSSLSNANISNSNESLQLKDSESVVHANTTSSGYTHTTNNENEKSHENYGVDNNRDKNIRYDVMDEPNSAYELSLNANDDNSNYTPYFPASNNLNLQTLESAPSIHSTRRRVQNRNQDNISEYSVSSPKNDSHSSVIHR
ncbi:similar to Saccharomyces cerevisiae YMR126C DLT1 Protein of unknown function, mutant sensitive to 6-azauracil (6AU) and mycophenolic acid (MPA) [Maudiozyma saulgeensis]|uniref:Defect at low temperature protein 1 n=1 Tax=Maudiozyma saulgeensis TaxID=1789683 RepID=A0A1X7R0J8_9SACH|nr:similar to Saccharomyces cerevisiae YMR126C DLT1 Protein of unknown function, mutant sensitive to 6-azauracil (6AU) and mycophenolic acid (MPA) [Kazachstania saulgeensis]